MFGKHSGLSRYVKWIMNCRYPASSLLSPSEFIKHASKRGIILTQGTLEYYDKIGILRPFMRVVTPVLDEKSQNERRKFCNADIFLLQHFYSIGLIELPRDGDYQNWSDYIQNGKDRCLYYHPYQILQLDQINTEVNSEINSSNLDNESELGDLRSQIRERLEWRKSSIVSKWIDWIGLLILLDEHYGPLVKTGTPFNMYDTTSYVDRNNEKNELFNKFNPNRILLLSGMKIEEIQNCYEWLSHVVRENDPIHKWFMLQQLAKLTRRYELTNQALLAQDYYSYLFMLASFIYDLSGKKVPDPDDILDSQKGRWKSRIFGEPFDYTIKRTQNQILKYFLWDRPFELVFVVEGQTEEKVIELILEARGVNLVKDGFFVYNIEGVDNLHHLKPLFRVSQLIDISIFVMVDNDKDVDRTITKMNESAKELGYTKEIMLRKWDRDFETENFGIDKVIEKANEILNDIGYNIVNKEDVQNRMLSSGDALVKAIENEIGRTNYQKFDGSKKVHDIFSKPRLGTLLIQDRLKEIKIIDDPDWNAKLPIEVELKKAFRLIPDYL